MSKVDANIEAELARVDAALDRGHVTATEESDRELEALALALADETPAPSETFDRSLRERVEAGFPRERRRPRLPRIALRRPPAPVLAGLATVLLATAVAVPLISDSGSSETGGAGAVPDEVTVTPRDRGADDDAAAPEQAPMTVGPVPPAGGDAGRTGEDFKPGQGERRIQRTASLTLAAAPARIEEVGDDIVAVADRLDGFVLDSSISSGEDSVQGGRFELRVPADQLRQALAELSKLGTVRARNQNGEDVTGSFVSAADRLAGAQAQRRSLLRRLAEADGDRQAEALRRSLDANASEVSGLRSQLRSLRRSTEYASIEVTLERKRSEGAATSGSSNGIGAAFDDALGSLSDAAEFAIRALGIVVPLGLLALLLGLATRTARRRRREAVLR